MRILSQILGSLVLNIWSKIDVVDDKKKSSFEYVIIWCHTFESFFEMFLNVASVLSQFQKRYSGELILILYFK